MAYESIDIVYKPHIKFDIAIKRFTFLMLKQKINKINRKGKNEKITDLFIAIILDISSLKQIKAQETNNY